MITASRERLNFHFSHQHHLANYLPSNDVPLVLRHLPQELLRQILLFLIQTALMLKLLEFQVFKVFALDIQQVSILWRKRKENEAQQSGCGLPNMKKEQ